MLLELRTVSRKTPGDGRLEITEATAQRLAIFGGELPVLMGSSRAAGVLTSMSCSCAKAGGDHVHHFLQSDLFRGLLPAMRVRIDLDEEAGAVRLVQHD